MASDHKLCSVTLAGIRCPRCPPLFILPWCVAESHGQTFWFQNPLSSVLACRQRCRPFWKPPATVKKRRGMLKVASKSVTFAQTDVFPLQGHSQEAREWALSQANWLQQNTPHTQNARYGVCPSSVAGLDRQGKPARYRGRSAYGSKEERLRAGGRRRRSPEWYLYSKL